jgi:hypothetical protein
MPNTPVKTPEAIQSQPEAEAIAPVWHTAAVLLLLLGLVALGLFMLAGERMGHAHNRVLGYLITMTVEWLIVAFIWLGGHWGGASLRTLVGNNSPRWRSILRDLGLAIAYLIAANIVLQILGAVLVRLLHSTSNDMLKNLLPHTALENAVFLLLSLTAGICEELIFRGYLQRQFTAWTGNAAAGIAMQGLVFGAAHAYQGLALILVISVYGCMFGWLAYWRKSLRPGMAAHFIQDGIGGLVLARFALK